MNEGLSLKNLTRQFDGHLAVDDVSFDVNHGELIALVGASGSGKTTTLRMVAGYEVPDKGEIFFNGANIALQPPERRGFGMVFQHYALFPHMSVVENVAFGLEARRVSKTERLKAAERVLESVGLGGKGSRRIQQLSGGEQQRVALARAIVIEPNALLLDEPLSNLDPSLRENTRDELRSMLHRVGAPALFVTHDQEDAFAIADRIVLLAKGKVLQVGTPDDLYHRPSSAEVAQFIGRSTLIPVSVSGSTASFSISGTARSVPIVSSRDEHGNELKQGRIVIRPESLELVSPDADSAWPGMVEHRRFAGSIYVYKVKLPDFESPDNSGSIEVEVAAENRYEEGENVGVLVRRLPLPLVP